MRILITGASGFIGGFLVEEALNKGWEVWAGVRKTSDKQYLSHPGIHFIELEFSNESLLLRQLSQHKAEFGAWDCIIHNAGITKCVHVDDFDRVNFQYTVNFVQALRKVDCLPAKFLFMSSLAAVGPGNPTNLAPVTPQDPPNPISDYGRSKLKAENHLRSMNDFPWLILRPTGVYGPRERDYFVMMKMIESGLDVSVGSRTQMLDFIYVKDLVKACFIALESNLIHKTWFVSDGAFHTSYAFSELVRQTLRKSRVWHLHVPLFLVKCVSFVSMFVSKRTGRPALLNNDKYLVMKQRNWTCDSSALRQDLSFMPDYDLRRGLEETVAWYRKNGWLKK